MKHFDIIVVGGGHAGIEAATAAARMGCNTALITISIEKIGKMSCNPAIGGSAKGHLVHEIDSLGGLMGIFADHTGIQFRTLNKSKGPSVWAGRCQSDRFYYPKFVVKYLSAIKNLTLIEDSVIELFEEDKKIRGIKTENGIEYSCSALVICAGTFLNGVMWTGIDSEKGGRHGDKHIHGLTECLVNLGFEAGRLKTGTPPRLNKNTIDFSKLKEQPGDNPPEPFSLQTDKSLFPFMRQVSCHLTYTDESVHEILRKGFDRSPLFTGRIKGSGPRYCPSIEDKIVRFKDKTAHQLFLEPEGLESDLIYVNGFPTSLPADIQYEAITKVVGLENCEMVRPGYAIEYDFFPPYQVDLTLETKIIRNLYFAGQINGTSGYEEAAAQGLIAGINAALKVQNKPEFILKRSEAYIGVLIDDLVVKSTNEPYRMFTSRAEHRLVLRQDNSDRRLIKYGKLFGLISDEVWEKSIIENSLINKAKELYSTLRIKANDLNKYLSSLDSNIIEASETVNKLVKRPEISLKELIENTSLQENDISQSLLANPDTLLKVEIEMKYEGYIQKQEELIERMDKFELINIPEDFNFSLIKSISTEGREKLTKIKPRTIAQASRISGLTPSDISILLVYLKK